MRWTAAVEGNASIWPAGRRGSEAEEPAEPEEPADGLAEVAALGVRVEPGVAVDEPVVGAVEETEADALEERGPEEPDALPDGAVVTGPRGDELTCRPSRWF